MGFIRMIIGLPLIIIIAVFAFMNNELVNFDFWPFTFKVTVSQSMAIIFFIVLGYIIGKVDSWMSYSSMRKALRCQVKQNKKLSAQQQKLSEKVQGLQGAIESSKTTINNTHDESSVSTAIAGAKDKVLNLFNRKKDDVKQDDSW